MPVYTARLIYAALNLAAIIAWVMILAVVLVRLGLYCLREIRAAWATHVAREDSPS